MFDYFDFNKDSNEFSPITSDEKATPKFWKDSNSLLALNESTEESTKMDIPLTKYPRLFSVKNTQKTHRWSNKNNQNLSKFNQLDVNKVNMGVERSNSFSKYQRMREIENIIGFVVNVHDATNFDIDIEISPEFHERYNNVISNQYTYQDLSNDFLENPNLHIKVPTKIGTTYRCRLRGVGINQLPQYLHIWKNNQMCVEVKQLIDRTDGWVVCTLSDIDVYQRLLVDITINTCNESINLREYLLNRMEKEETPIFYSYTSKRDKIKQI